MRFFCRHRHLRRERAIALNPHYDELARQINALMGWGER